MLHSQPAQRHTSNEAHVSDPGSNFTSDVEKVQVKNKMKTVQSPESRTGRTVVTDDGGGDKQYAERRTRDLKLQQFLNELKPTVTVEYPQYPEG